MPSQLIVLEVFNNEIDAEIVKGRLNASGIDAFVSKDDCGGMRPHLQPSQGVRLLIPDSDIELAKEILQSDIHEASEEKQDSMEAETWECSGCGEIHERQFTECWKCDKSRTALS